MFWDTRKNTAECVFVQFCDTRKNIAECVSCGDEEKEKTETASVFPFVNGKKRGEHSGMCFKFFH